MPVAKQFSRLRHIDSKCMKRQRARLKLERVQGWEQTLQREGMTIKWLFYTFPRVFLDIPTRSCPTRSCIRSHLRIHCSRMAGMAIFGLPLRFSLCAAKVSKWHKLVGVEGVKASTSACAQAEWLAFGTSWDTATCKIEIRVAPLKTSMSSCFMDVLHANPTWQNAGTPPTSSICFHLGQPTTMSPIKALSTFLHWWIDCQDISPTFCINPVSPWNPQYFFRTSHKPCLTSLPYLTV